MIISYNSSLYTLVIGECREQYGKNLKREIIVRLGQLVDKELDVQVLHMLINTIISLLYPRIETKAPGTETLITCSVLNKPHIKKSSEGTGVLRDLLDGGEIIHVYSLDEHFAYSGDTNNFLNFDTSFEFFITGGKIATARLQVFPTSDKYLP